VILPLLPNEPHGPYGVLNPFKIWLMVVLIEGVSLAGFFAWRLTDSRRGILLTGVLGGLVSSTATTFVQARKVKLGESPPVPAAFVILLANATMIVRVLTIVSIAAPSIAAAVSAALVPALPLSVPAFLVLWKATRREGRAGAQDYENPSHLRAALTFAVLYTLTLLASAWASSRFGAGGAYATAAVSGVADVDAITLSAADLARSGSVDARVAATMVALAVSTNLVVKTTIAGVAGGYALGRVAAAALAGPLAGLASGIALVRLLGL
jgi:uncharacterized membrane protein (DUF4010 family)